MRYSARSALSPRHGQPTLVSCPVQSTFTVAHIDRTALSLTQIPILARTASLYNPFAPHTLAKVTTISLSFHAFLISKTHSYIVDSRQSTYIGQLCALNTG